MDSADEESLELIKQHLKGRVNLSREFLNFLDRCEDPAPALLMERIDESDYSVADWGEALIVFDSWLDEQKQASRPFPSMVGYIHCCTLMNAPQVSLPSLKVTVYQLLTDYGFEALSDPQI